MKPIQLVAIQLAGLFAIGVLTGAALVYLDGGAAPADSEAASTSQAPDLPAMAAEVPTAEEARLLAAKAMCITKPLPKPAGATPPKAGQPFNTLDTLSEDEEFALIVNVEPLWNRDGTDASQVNPTAGTVKIDPEKVSELQIGQELEFMIPWEEEFGYHGEVEEIFTEQDGKVRVWSGMLIEGDDGLAHFIISQDAHTIKVLLAINSTDVYEAKIDNISGEGVLAYAP